MSAMILVLCELLTIISSCSHLQLTQCGLIKKNEFISKGACPNFFEKLISLRWGGEGSKSVMFKKKV